MKRTKREEKLKIASVVLIASSLALVAGCANRNRRPASPPPAPNPLWSVPFAEKDFDKQEPSVVHAFLSPIDVDRDVEVGNVVYVDGVRTQTIETVVRVLKAVSVALEAGHMVSIESGKNIEMKTRKVGGEQLAGCVKTQGGGRYGEKLTSCLVDLDNDGQFDVAMFEKYERQYQLETKIPYVIEAVTAKSEANYGGVRKELIYGGASNGNLKLTYREFTADGMARQAFTQDLTYELDKQGRAEIGFRGLRMTVHSATNSQISYRVTRQMD
ncbi:MAG TPA: hypothetical protein VGF12_22430 [Roseateles sp.]|uniref:hypothetical protein n=1 Tax=Roseateles sp. TaxID=1971397 RepID=UPI002ED93529